MPIKTIQSKKTYPIPIRLSWEEKHVLEELSKENNLPLSTFIKKQIEPVIKPHLGRINKVSVLIDKIDAVEIPKKDLEITEKAGKRFRKNFKLTK